MRQMETGTLECFFSFLNQVHKYILLLATLKYNINLLTELFIHIYIYIVLLKSGWQVQ
jgi:hypothetical protein